MGIDGEYFSGAHHQKENGSEQRAKIGACLMRHAPETVARQFRQAKAPKFMTEQDGDFRRQNRDGNIDDQRNRGQPGQETDDEQRATNDFHAADERSEQLGDGKADFGKSARAQLVGEQKFLDSFR